MKSLKLIYLTLIFLPFDTLKHTNSDFCTLACKYKVEINLVF